MLCWYDGEYREADLSHIGGLEKILEIQKETFSKYAGLTVGDFNIRSVSYDWGKHCQRVETVCNRCGAEDVKYLNFSAWKRGRGESRQCPCGKIKPPKPPKEPKPVFDPGTLIGSEMFGWIVDSTKDNQLIVKCEVCGKTKQASVSQFKGGKIYSCNHKSFVDYSDPKWIGERNGHLTAIKYKGKYFDCRCDCGNVVSVKSTFLFTYKTATSCGGEDCPFTTDIGKKENIYRDRGNDYERKVVERFKENGYNVEQTKGSGDFGVDILMKLDDKRVAIQCKRLTGPSTVRSIQEVYAGGRYYDCNRFAVISPSGFTDNALRMAAKLGVYCAVHQFDLSELDNARDACLDLLNTQDPIDCWKSRRAKTYTLNGNPITVKEVNETYGIPIGTIHSKLNSGKTMEDIVFAGYQKPSRKEYTVDGFTGTLQEIGDRYGILAQTVQYRMKYRGMTIEDAVKTPLQEQGRPKKSAS